MLISHTTTLFSRLVVPRTKSSSKGWELLLSLSAVSPTSGDTYSALSAYFSSLHPRPITCCDVFVGEKKAHRRYETSAGLSCLSTFYTRRADLDPIPCSKLLETGLPTLLSFVPVFSISSSPELRKLRSATNPFSAWRRELLCPGLVTSVTPAAANEPHHRHSRPPPLSIFFSPVLH